MWACPFYWWFCRKRKKRCVGYFEGWTDAQMCTAARMLLEFLDQYEITEEGAKAFATLHEWQPPTDEERAILHILEVESRFLSRVNQGSNNV